MIYSRQEKETDLLEGSLFDPPPSVEGCGRVSCLYTDLLLGLYGPRYLRTTSTFASFALFVPSLTIIPFIIDSIIKINSASSL